MRRFAVLLLLLCGCNNHHNDQRWFSKDGKDCAAVIYNASIDEWDVKNNLGPATFPEEKDALAFARSMCGGGDIQVAASRKN